LALIKVHPLSGVLVVVAVLAGQATTIVVLFALALWHELGHYVAARACGWRIRAVHVMPFGGVLEVDESASRPLAEEALVAIAGPLQHVWLIGALWLAEAQGWLAPALVGPLVRANVGLLLFNLLPVSPLDGGKLLAALASARVAYYRMLRASAIVGIAGGAAGLIASGLLLRHGGLAVNLAVVSAFVLYSNLHALRHVPYVFRRFLLHRKFPPEAQLKPIYYRQTPSIPQATHHLLKERKSIHVGPGWVMPEEVVVRRFWREEKVAGGHRL
jgi:stage IV sporulation protein FB